MKTRWWMTSSIVIGALMLMFGVGNLVDPDDNGPLYGQLIMLAGPYHSAVLLGPVALIEIQRRQGIAGLGLPGRQLFLRPGLQGVALKPPGHGQDPGPILLGQ